MGERARETYVWCRDCIRRGRNDRGCERCKYVCVGCGKLRPWSNGGTDDVRCDECWCADPENRSVEATHG